MNEVSVRLFTMYVAPASLIDGYSSCFTTVDLIVAEIIHMDSYINVSGSKRALFHSENSKNKICTYVQVCQSFHYKPKSDGKMSYLTNKRPMKTWIVQLESKIVLDQRKGFIFLPNTFYCILLCTSTSSQSRANSNSSLIIYTTR